MTTLDHLRKLYKDCDLGANDIYKHRHYTIISRTGIEKIQYKRGIDISYEMVACQPDFCVVKATGSMPLPPKEHGVLKAHSRKTLETFGSAKQGGKVLNPTTKKWTQVGTTDTWYVAEMAEKRAMSRIVLKLTMAYEIGDVFSEDELEHELREKDVKTTDKSKESAKALQNALNSVKK